MAKSRSLSDRLHKLEEDSGFLISAYVAGFDVESWGRVIAIVERAELAQERALQAGKRSVEITKKWQRAIDFYEEGRPPHRRR